MCFRLIIQSKIPIGPGAAAEAADDGKSKTRGGNSLAIKRKKYS
jgi:hypothetical protein